MMRRLLVGLVAMITISAGLVMTTNTAPAQAATYCNASGTIGKPKIVNVGGGKNPVRLKSSAGVWHKVYVYHPQYFCPATVHTDWGYTFYVECVYRQATFWYPHWGNHKMKTYCAGLHKGTIWVQELHH